MATNTVIRTNVLALNAHRALEAVTNQQSTAARRLSSGFRINSAADDAAGLGITTKMRAQIRSIDQASRNAQDAISLIQTAEGALSTVNHILIRVRELIIQAANDTNVGGDGGSLAQALGTYQDSNATFRFSDRLRIQDEIDQLMAEIDSIAIRTKFNTRTLLDGSFDDSKFYVDIKNSVALVYDCCCTVQMTVTNSNILTSSQSYFLYYWAWRNPNVLVANVSKTATQWDTILATSWNNYDGASMTPEPEPLNSIQAERLNIWFNRYRFEWAYLMHRMVLYESSLVERRQEQNLWFHTGSNSNQGLRLRIGSISTADLFSANQNHGFGSGQTRIINVMNLSGYDTQAGMTTGNSRSNYGSGNEASPVTSTHTLIEVVDAALVYISRQRSNLGAKQNRLEFTIENLDIASENLSASKSRIMDADMAKEMKRLTKANILQQAATAMLAQANQSSENILHLLR